MWKSLREYLAALGYWGLIVIVPITLDAIGIYQLSVDSQFTSIPSWAWFQIALVVILAIPFIAFHRMRVRLQSVTENRSQELARLILQVRNAAARAVLHYRVIKDHNEEVKEAYEAYIDALDLLGTEAEIEGGKVKEIIQDNFTSFVRFHVTRFLAWNGQIVSDPDTKKKLEIDEYQFIGNMASRADQAIQDIRALMR